MTLFFIIFLFTLGLVPFTYFAVNTKVGTVQNVPVEEKFDVAYSNWVASDGSEMVFSGNTFYWYQKEGEHDDNYYFGSYELYVGDAAVNFITTDLSKYGITRSELNDLFDRNEEYNVENFVVFNLNYSSTVIDGENSVPEISLVPWYGFVLEDGTYLDVANMNTGTYYKFTLQ